MTETLTIRVPCGFCGRAIEARVTHRRTKPVDGVAIVRTTITESQHRCRAKERPGIAPQDASGAPGALRGPDSRPPSLQPVREAHSA